MSLVHTFRDEIEKVQDDKMRSFVVDALTDVPEFYRDQKQYIEQTKTAFRLAETFCDVLDTEDNIYDMIGVAVLLQDVTKYELDEGDIRENLTHPLSVRNKYLYLQREVGLDTYDSIMRIIESSHGAISPIPQVMPSMEDPVFVWILPFVNELAKEETA